MLNIVMLIVIMLNVIMLSVVAPFSSNSHSVTLAKLPGTIVNL
jgi:hypothetical protein